VSTPVTTEVLHQRTPIAQWLVVDVQIQAAYVDVVVAHTLNSLDVRMQVIDATSAGVVFRGTKPATPAYLSLQASASGFYRVLLFLETQNNPSSRLPKARTPDGATGTSPVVTAASLPALTGDVTSAAGSAATTVVGASGLFDISGAGAGQIKFPAAQHASSDANTLDDYEEGTWTPVIGGSTSESGQAYSIQDGRYIKIGKYVHLQFNVVLSTKGTITGNLRLKGLPFVALNFANAYSSGLVQWFSMATNWVMILLETIGNNAILGIWGLQAAGADLGALNTAALGNTSELLGQLSYLADA
jgi:hypothetical protein